MNEWIKKMWYVYTVEYYAAIRKKKNPPFVNSMFEPEGLMSSEIKQTVIHL